jgi:hypothetical protein
MTAPKTQIEPLISLKIYRHDGIFHPDENLECEYQIDAVEPSDIQAVEASVLWFTEGKGDEDLGVHYFERSRPSDAVDGDLRQLQRLQCRLPPSPLTYHGKIVKIHWCVRVRVFLRHGKDYCADRLFQLSARRRAV